MSKENHNNIKDYRLGMIGLGTMGRNLLLNMGEHGFSVSGFDVDSKKVSQLEEEGKDYEIKGYTDVIQFVESLQTPRAIMLLVPAGTIVDKVIQQLLPLLDKGDLIIDGGNSHFTDTDRRIIELKGKGIHFFGMGISGGEEGARHGPSMMPGGDEIAYEVVKPILEAIAAKVNNDPCVVYIGPGASGHFVKMVHNGIEYALMQLIAESYEILRKGLEMDDVEMHQVYQEWNKGKLHSYLLEITGAIFGYKEPNSDHLLLEKIKDEAKSKGTGKWTSQVAMDLNLSIPTIDTAVSIRDLSKFKTIRTEVSAIYSSKEKRFFKEEDKFSFINELEDALFFAMIIAYSQGMHLLSQASQNYGYSLKLDEIAKIWRGGCIIRSRFLDNIKNAYQKENGLSHLLLDGEIESLVKENLASLQSVVISAVSHGVAIPALSSALSYFDSLRTENMPANLIQAQRDYFGAHAYERIDKLGVFHTQWEE